MTKRSPGAKAEKFKKRTDRGGKPVRNKALLATPYEEFELIRPHLEYVKLPHRRVLHKPHRTVKFAHLPNEGLISLVVEMKDGKTVEAGLLGNDGASGLPAVLGLTRSPLQEVVQISGSAFRIKVSTLKKLLPSTPQFQVILTRFASGLAMQVAQTAACNRLHKIEKRLARWLLIAEDRLETPVVAITHDFLATMLGTDRPSVTLAANILQGQGLIGHSRGSIKILNRTGLEAFACECCGVVKKYNRANA